MQRKYPCWHVSGTILGWPEHWVWVIVEESRGSAAFRGVSQKGVQQRKYPVLDCCRTVERSSRRGKDFQTTRWCNLQDLHQWHSSFRGTNINDNLMTFSPVQKVALYLKYEVRGTFVRPGEPWLESKTESDEEERRPSKRHLWRGSGQDLFTYAQRLIPKVSLWVLWFSWAKSECSGSWTLQSINSFGKSMSVTSCHRPPRLLHHHHPCQDPHRLTQSSTEETDWALSQSPFSNPN